MKELSRDLRIWIKEVEEIGLLREIKGADWNLEIGAITDTNAKKNKFTLLFDEIKDYPRGHRVLTGALLDSKRVSLSLGLNSNLKDLELAKELKERISRVLTRIEEFNPKFIEDSPLMENVEMGEKINLYKFPAPKWFEHDGGRYIGTADAVITKGIKNDWVNVGTYRIMLCGKDRLCILMEAPRHARAQVQEYFDQGKPCPVAVSFGHHPSLFIFSGIEVPPGVSEYNYVGAVTGKPYEVIRGPVTGLPIPADSELAIEGFIVNETMEEGPFGEFMGYYAGGKMLTPTIIVKAVYYRENPIILGTCAGKPPYDYSYFRCPIRSALIWDILEKAGIPNVKGVWCHEAGYSRAFTVVSIKQAYAGHARMAGHVASQSRPGAVAGRYVIVVDDDIDPSNLNDVVWAMSSRTDPATGIDIIPETIGTPLDPIAEHEEGKNILEYTSSRAIIYAVKPFRKIIRNEFPMVVEPSEELKGKVMKKWKEIFT